MHTTTTVLGASHSRFKLSFYGLSLSLALLSALAGCGGSDDNSDYSASLPSGQLVAASPDQLANSAAEGSTNSVIDPSAVSLASSSSPSLSSPVATAAPLPTAVKATPLRGSVIEIISTGANITLDQFAGQVRQSMDVLEGEVGITLQWVALFHSSKGVRHAYVTVVDVGKGKASVATEDDDDSASSEYDDDSVTSEYSTSATSSSDDTMTPEQVKEVACAGGSASNLDEYYKFLRDFDDATEALAVGMAIGTSREMVDQRLDQLLNEEMHLPAAVSAARANARFAVRDQRYVAKRECRQR